MILGKKNILLICIIILISLILSFILGIIVCGKFDQIFDDIEVQCMVGEYYDNKKEYTKAFKWYMKAAVRKNPVAQNNLGVLYNEGTGTNQDFEQAMKWYTKSAHQGYGIAAHNLGHLFGESHFKRDDNKAVEWYKIAVSHGCMLSLNNLGLKYQFGQGIEQDCNKAVELFETAAKQDVELAKLAQYNLGVIYEEGCGDIQQNYSSAIKWYRKAANSGWKEAKQKLIELEESIIR